MDNKHLYDLLKDNTAFTEKLVNTILDKKELHIESCDLHINVVPCIKAVMDNGDEVFIYGSKTDVSAEAARMYSSQACYEAGEDRNSDIYLIFICDHDHFNTGNPVEWIVSRVVETGALFDDGLYMIYVNGQYNDDSEIGKLIQEMNQF